MSFHRNAKLGLAGRYALVCAIEGGMTLQSGEPAAGRVMSGAAGWRARPTPLPPYSARETDRLLSWG